MRAFQKPQQSDTCPHCEIAYARFMAGQFGKGSNRLEQAQSGAIKRAAWAEHLAYCGQNQGPLDIPGHYKAEKARHIILEMLTLGETAANEIYSAATRAGIGKRNVQEAKADLGVESRRDSHGNEGRGEWLWALPVWFEERGAA